MTEHTPTPWVVCHPTPSHQATRGWIKSVCKGFPERMVAQATGQETTEEREANAAFIVQAVNNHERLVEALKLQEKADKFHMECEECDGEEAPELCEECFPLYDDARVARRAILTVVSSTPVPSEQHKRNGPADYADAGRGSVATDQFAEANAPATPLSSNHRGSD